MATPTVVKVSRRYQIAVPSIVRKKLNIQKGDQLLVDVQGDIVILIPKPLSYTQNLSGLHKELMKGIDAENYISGERDSWKPSNKN
jgi:AbrB family looped-hinge helix DNA binding protein